MSFSPNILESKLRVKLYEAGVDTTNMSFKISNPGAKSVPTINRETGKLDLVKTQTVKIKIIPLGSFTETIDNQNHKELVAYFKSLYEKNAGYTQRVNDVFNATLNNMLIDTHKNLKGVTFDTICFRPKSNAEPFSGHIVAQLGGKNYKFPVENIELLKNVPDLTQWYKNATTHAGESMEDILDQHLVTSRMKSVISQGYSVSFKHDAAGQHSVTLKNGTNGNSATVKISDTTYAILTSKEFNTSDQKTINDLFDSLMKSTRSSLKRQVLSGSKKDLLAGTETSITQSSEVVVKDEIPVKEKTASVSQPTTSDVNTDKLKKADTLKEKPTKPKKETDLAGAFSAYLAKAGYTAEISKKKGAWLKPYTLTIHNSKGEEVVSLRINDKTNIKIEQAPNSGQGSEQIIEKLMKSTSSYSKKTALRNILQDVRKQALSSYSSETNISNFEDEITVETGAVPNNYALVSGVGLSHALSGTNLREPSWSDIQHLADIGENGTGYGPFVGTKTAKEITEATYWALDKLGLDQPRLNADIAFDEMGIHIAIKRFNTLDHSQEVVVGEYLVPQENIHGLLNDTLNYKDATMDYQDQNILSMHFVTKKGSTSIFNAISQSNVNTTIIGNHRDVDSISVYSDISSDIGKVSSV